MNETLREAFEFFKGGEKQKAAKLLAALVIQEPNNANAWLGLGVCLDDKEKQIYCFQKVLSIEPDNSQAKEMLEKLSPNVPLPGPQPEGPGIETKECAHCGESNPEGLNWCRNCGGDLRDSPTVEIESSEDSVSEPQIEEPKIESLECPYCGVPIHEGANWCRNCGRNLRDIPSLEEGVSEVQVPSAEPETQKIQQYPEYQPVERKEEESKRFNPILVGVIIIALIGVIGALFFTFYRMDQVSQAVSESLVFSPNPTNTSRPQIASPNTDPNPETSTITPPYFEDFSNGPGIWHVRTDDDVSFSVSDRQYVINPKNPGGSWWTSSEAKLDNVLLEFTTSFLYTYPMEDGGFRVNFRCVDTDAEDCYKMYVSENGYLFVHRDENTLVDHKLSQYINLYDNPNHWAIVMDGSDFEIRCNGELLATFSDSKLKSGDFGFGVFNSENDEWGFNGVAFDDIRVTSLD